MRLTHHPTPPAGLSPARDRSQPRTSRRWQPATDHSGARVTPGPSDWWCRGAQHQFVVVLALTALVVLLNAPAAHAAPSQVLALAGSIDQVLTNIRTWVMGILASLATVFLSLGGVRYVMGGGDPGEIEKAKTAFKSAALGYSLAALAPVVVTVLQGIVGA